MANRSVRYRLVLDAQDFRKKVRASAKEVTGLQRLASGFKFGLGVGGAITVLGTLRSATEAVSFALKTSARASISWQEAFAGVRKTLDASEAEFKAIDRELLGMSTRLPVVATELAGIAESAGQLGVAARDVSAFTESVAGVGIATDLAATQAATGFARLDAILSKGRGEFERTASALVDLGNNSAATESEILDLALGFAPVAEQMKLTRGETLGISAAIRSVGIESEAGASAISSSFIEMQQAVLEGGETLEIFAGIAGRSTSEFADLFRRDAAGAMVEFLAGLDEFAEKGGNVFGVLEDLNLSEKRVRKTVLALASAHEQATEAVDRGNRAFEENVALTEEVAKRNETTASRLQRLENAAFGAAKKFGDVLGPALSKFLELAEESVGDLDDLADSMGKSEQETGRMAAAASDLADALRLLKSLSKLTIEIGLSLTAGGFGRQLLKAIPGLGLIPLAADAQRGLESASGALDAAFNTAREALGARFIPGLGFVPSGMNLGRDLGGTSRIGSDAFLAGLVSAELESLLQESITDAVEVGLTSGFDRAAPSAVEKLHKAIVADLDRQGQDAIEAVARQFSRGVELGFEEAFGKLDVSPLAFSPLLTAPGVPPGGVDFSGKGFAGLVEQAAAELALDDVGDEIIEIVDSSKVLNHVLQGTALIASAIGGRFAEVPDVIRNIAREFEMAESSADRFAAIATGLGQIGGLIGGPVGGAIQGGAGGALAGFALGSVVPGIGNVAGAVIGGLIGGIGGLFGGSKAQREEEERQRRLLIEDSFSKLDQLSARIDEIFLEKLTRGATGLAAVFEQAGQSSDLTQDRLDRLGRLGVVVFQQLREEGLSTVEVMRVLGPAFEQASEAAEKHGLELSGLFGDLADFQQLVLDNDVLVNAAEGIAALFDALRSTGNLTQDAFNDLSAEISATYDELIDRGFTAEQALVILARSLFFAKTASEDLGLEVDETTAELIAQAEAMGLFENMEDPMKELIEIQKLMLEAVAALVLAFGEELPAAVQAYIDKINQIPTPPPPPGVPPGGPTDVPDVPGAASGGLVKARPPAGRLFRLAEREDEYAVPESKADDFARARLQEKGLMGGAAAAVRAGAGRGSAREVHLHLQLGGREVGDALLELSEDGTVRVHQHGIVAPG